MRVRGIQSLIKIKCFVKKILSSYNTVIKSVQKFSVKRPKTDNNSPDKRVKNCELLQQKSGVKYKKHT